MPIALVPVNLDTTFLGLPSRTGELVAGRPVLHWTLARLARIASVERIVIVHRAGQEPLWLLNIPNLGKPISSFAADPSESPHSAARAAARKWSLNAWRGGLGGATCYDELLPAAPLAAAMCEHKAESALLVGGDWLCVDPHLCEAVLARHLEYPREMQLVFTQSPPGLAGVAVHRELLENLAETNATFGQLLAYNPAKPQADPIGQDVCVQIPHEVRNGARRFIHDTPRSATLISAVAQRLGDRFAEAGALEVVRCAQTVEAPAALPQQVTLELTPRRLVDGPIVPQHHVSLERDDLPLDEALRIVRQLGEAGDVALTLGGLGDALLHPHWEQIVLAAHHAGVLGIAVETDLLCEPPVIDRLLELPIDVVSVRLNADRAATYARVMTSGSTPPGEGERRFAQATANLERFLNTRNRLRREAGKRIGVPWLVPRMVKTAETLGDLETFFDRWMHYAGHAVIDPAPTGCGLMPDLNVIQMAPPARKACHQLGSRMTILSNASVAQCDQDWLGRAPLGSARKDSLEHLWRNADEGRQAHSRGNWDASPLCAACDQWHRP